MKRLLWDAEFSPNKALVWRTGRKIHVSADSITDERQIISVAWKWHGKKKVHSMDWGRDQNDTLLLFKFGDVLNESDEAVAHFGDGYDWPMFKARCMIRGISTNPYVKTVDTCKMARKFGFNSKSLDYLAKVLGVGEKMDTGFGLWKRVVLDNDQVALQQMVKYNRHDVFPLLEGVYDRLIAESKPTTHAAVLAGGERWNCPHCESKKVKVSKTRVTAAGTKQYQMACNNCGRYFSISQKSHDEYIANK